jgi:hypothetical protein
MSDLTAAPSVPRNLEPIAFDLDQLSRTFAEDGYVVLRDVVSKEALARMHGSLKKEFAEWQRSGELFKGGGLMSGHLNCYPGKLAAEVLDELRQRGVIALAQHLKPFDPKATRLGLNFNLPGSHAQHYHMDGLYLENYLIVNVAVVDTDLHNGAIDMIPKTHKRFYKYWEFATGRVYRDAKRLCVSAGDVLVRLSTVWHRGMPNYSDEPRPMFALTLGEKGVENADPFAYRDGRVEFQTNWFNTSLLGRVRERTFVTAPITYAAYRFARSLVGNKGYATF